MAAGATGETGCMDTDDEQPTAQETQREMEDEAGGMQRRVDELGDHVEEAAKKARETRAQTTLDDDE